MSRASNFSKVTVSYRGQDDQDLEKVLDQQFNELQDTINNSHYAIKLMAMDYDQDNSFNNRCETYFKLLQYFDLLEGLSKELRKICKDVMGKPQTNDEKEFYQKQSEEYKNSKSSKMRVVKKE